MRLKPDLSNAFTIYIPANPLRPYYRHANRFCFAAVVMDMVDLSTLPIPRLSLSSDSCIRVVLTLLLAYVIKRIWMWYPWKVQCWFCHAFTKVKWNCRNSWVCPHCEQYNGFNTDGDYNRPIESMYDERKNKRIWPMRARNHSSLNSPDAERSASVLCSDCNKLLEVKINMLAKFSPTDERNCEKEMENYKASLENIYRICPQCELAVLNKLRTVNDSLGLTGVATNALLRTRRAFSSITSSVVSQRVSPSVSIRSSSSRLPSKRGPLASCFRAGSAFVGLLLSVITWLSSLDLLRADSDNEEFLFLTRALAPFSDWLSLFNRLAPMLSLIAILLRVVFYKYSRTVMLIDHICSFGWVFLFGSYLVPQLLVLNEEQEREMFVWQMLLSTGNCIIVFWTLLLPRRIPLKCRRSRRSRMSSPNQSIPVAASTSSASLVERFGRANNPISDVPLPVSLSNGATSSCTSSALLESELRRLSLSNASADHTFGRTRNSIAQRQSSVSISTAPGPPSVSSVSTYRWPVSEFQQSRVTDLVFGSPNGYDLRSPRSTLNFMNN
uniref:Ima1_N domain-containing protein n=1 Tax=Trichuris muris TaxID=70415 RepID=A0A5S6QC09_TRIMR